MCNLYSITTNQAAIAALFRVMNRYVGNLAPMPGVFPDYPAPVVRNAGTERDLTMMRWGMPPPPKFGGPPITNIRNTSSPALARLAEARKSVPGAVQQLLRIRARTEPRDEEKGRGLVRAG
jgi:putative SOS response-associated peptidase YedK